MGDEDDIMLKPHYEVLVPSGIDSLLSQIRPHWRAKNLIERVKKLLPADPSSACQRVFNASIHDLKEKLAVAGIDIVADAARQNKLPPIVKPEDIENYSPYHTIELAYRVGLLTKAESRRLFRVYEIRGDLEHEDDEYEALPQDCIYVFTTCIECVLSRDPVEIIKLPDIKGIVEQPTAITLGESIIEDFQHAPIVRQLEIHKFLISHALNGTIPDIVRQNCYMALTTLKPYTHTQVLIASAQEFTKRIGRNAPDLLHSRVAYAAGVLPYLKRVQLRDLFKTLYEQMEATGYSFRSHAQHGELLRNLKEVGGLEYCPQDMRNNLLEWLVLLYIGEPGGYGLGTNRPVFYSNAGARLAYDIIKDSIQVCTDAFSTLQRDSKKIHRAVSDQYVARRFETLVDLFQSSE